MYPATRSSAELPVLRLGLAGFAPDEEALLCVELARRSDRQQLAWQLAPLGEADAWCVSGPRLRRLPDGSWRIVPVRVTDHPIHINPEHLEWPVAFSTPAGPSDFQPAHLFDLDSPASIGTLFEHLEGWLRPAMAQFHLAAHIVQGKVDLSAGVYHVTVQGKLYAVVSRRGGVGVWPLADPAQLAQAEWNRRPAGAEAMPASFVRSSVAETMWQYATRTTRDCLPKHYRRQRLYLLRPPQLPPRLLSDRCLLVVRELERAPATFNELLARTGAGAADLARQLAGLHMVGAVTANEARVAPPYALSEPGWSSSLLASQRDSDGAGLDATVHLKAVGGGLQPCK